MKTAVLGVCVSVSSSLDASSVRALVGVRMYRG
jgi:hypothetical protein